jgi:gluconolactonase
MKRWLVTACLALVNLSCLAAESDRPKQLVTGQSTVGHIERLNPAINAIVPDDAVIEILANGHGWAEGPLWVPQLNALLYSDIPANAIYIYSNNIGSRPWIEPSLKYPSGSGGANGLSLDLDGQLLLAQHGDRRIARLKGNWEQAMPQFEVVTARFENHRFNSPNDLVLHRDGSLYFTDPPYGLSGGADDPARELDIQGVYRLSANGDVALLVENLTRPNGIGLSPAQDVLYIANSGSDQRVIMAYDLHEDGSIESERVFFNSWGDGLTVDQSGNVYVAEPERGVLVINPQGVLLGRFLTDNRTSNVAFGDDGTSLYNTADSYLLRVRLNAKGTGFREAN